MNCASCGFPVPENASFCPQCGAFAGACAPQPEPAPQPQQPFASAPQPQPATPQPAPGSALYEKGCIAAAWQDVRESPEWLSRTAILGIIQCVPILNFFAAGYALNWAREVPFGGKTPMPKKIFSGENFEIGFYSFVIVLLFSLVGSLAAGILAIVPVIGALAGALLGVGLAAMACLCCVRVGIKQRFGAGFELGVVWACIMRNPGSFLAAALIPIVAASVLVSLACAVGALLGMGTVVPFMIVDGGIAFAIVGVMALVGSLVLYVICCVLVMAATLVTDRALAHWVGRYASEWIVQ